MLDGRYFNRESKPRYTRRPIHAQRRSTHIYMHRKSMTTHSLSLTIAVSKDEESRFITMFGSGLSLPTTKRERQRLRRELGKRSERVATKEETGEGKKRRRDKRWDLRRKIGRKREEGKDKGGEAGGGGMEEIGKINKYKKQNKDVWKKALLVSIEGLP